MKRTTRSAATPSLARPLAWARKQRLVSLAVVLLVACGGDDGGDDDESDGNGGTGSERGGASVGLPAPGTDFIISCIDQSGGDCNEYIADESGRKQVEEVATDICKRYNSKLSMEPCTRERNVGTCTRTSQYEGVRYTIKNVFYPPLTSEAAELRCGSGKFQASGG